LNILCWPENDIFLSSGFSSCFNQEKHCDNLNILVVNLTGTNIVDFIKSGIIPPRDNHEIVIVYDTNQKPLAEYCVNTFNNVVAAFPKTDCIQKIKFLIQDKQKSPKEATCAHLTDREFESLLMYVNGYTAINHARKMNVSVKTIYTHRKHLSMKMGVRKISDLFIKA